jgi:hypothetical protein|nr:MAG TPA: Protein of unknown function (DUF1700) [Caudoviricetes sp.]
MIKIALGILLAVIVYKIVVGILRAPGKAIDSFNENIDRKLQKLDAEKKAQEEAAYREEMRRIALMSDEEKKEYQKRLDEQKKKQVETQTRATEQKKQNKKDLKASGKGMIMVALGVVFVFVVLGILMAINPGLALLGFAALIILSPIVVIKQKKKQQRAEDKLTEEFVRKTMEETDQSKNVVFLNKDSYTNH